MPPTRHPNTIEIGSKIRRRLLTDISGRGVPIFDGTRLVHLQFRRFAGCPVCSLHLRSFARRHGEFAKAKIHEIVVFHSSARELSAHANDLPFTLIPDPNKKLYAEFGVTSSLRSLLDPRVWSSVFLAVVFALKEMRSGHVQAPSLRPNGGRWGLPADFLIDTDGQLIALKYGRHADDQWSVDEVLELAGARHEKTRTDMQS
jgi:peroxiredoxin